MGFMTPSVPSPSTEVKEPPVVTEVTQNDTAADYDQKNARRKSLLSSILTPRPGTLSTAGSNSANSTLG